MAYKTDYDAWSTADHDDLWVFDKLIVARKAGHSCGTRGMVIPENGMYCIRPVTNFKGMGALARIEYRKKDDEMMDIHPGEFWVEMFSGTHVSVDYINGEQFLTVAGYRNGSDPLHKFRYWTKERHYLPLPKFLAGLASRHPVVNCEFIGGKLVEVHLRPNPDFLWGNSKVIAVWKDEEMPKIPEGMRYIEDPVPEEHRLGIIIDYIQ